MPKKITKKTMVAPPSALYRRIAFSFIAVAVILLGTVSYISFSKVTIIIKPKREALTVPLTVDVGSEAESSDIIGAVEEKIVEAAETFQVKDGGTTVPAAATGEVTIFNTTSRNQPLVRTTRLLSSDGVLFHIDEGVQVPAGGSVEVGVYADQEGAGGEIGASKFIIPGLWEGLRDKIYAESDESMCCGTKTVKAVTSEDLEQAAKTLQERMTTEAEAVMPEAEVELNGREFFTELLERKSDTEPGSEADSFTISLKLKVTGVFYDDDALLDRAREVLRELAGPEREFVDVDEERTTIEVERYDAESGTARLAVEAASLLVLRPESSIFDKDRLVGLDRIGLQQYFNAWRSVESVEFRFQPPWLQKVPRLKDHIEIKIQN